MRFRFERHPVHRRDEAVPFEQAAVAVMNDFFQELEERLLRHDVRSNPDKTAALKGDLSGWWSRRITADHRLVDRVAVQPGTDQRIAIVACRHDHS